MEEKDFGKENTEIESNINVEEKSSIQDNVNLENANNENDNIENTASTVNSTKKQKNIILRTLGIIGKTLGIAIIIFAVVILVRALVLKKYDVFGYRFYLIMSGSMEPTINVGDAVITKEISEPQIGDVIAFEVSNSTTVHRIVKTYTEENNKLYQTKGDNNNAEDRTLLNKEQIKGKVVFKLPKVGDAILFLQKNIVIILILIVGIAIIITLIRRLM